MIVLKNGVWDILHIGHLNVLRIAAGLGTLVVGVATDEYVQEYKGCAPTVSFHDRAALVGALRMVEAIVPYTGPEDTTAVDILHVDIMVMDQYYGIGDAPHAKRQRDARKMMEARGVRYVLVPYTPNISSTILKEKLDENS